MFSQLDDVVSKAWGGAGTFRLSIICLRERLPHRKSPSPSASPHQVSPHPLFRVQKRKEEDPVSELCFMRGWNGHLCGFGLSVLTRPEVFETCQLSCFNWEDVIPERCLCSGSLRVCRRFVLLRWLCSSTPLALTFCFSSVLCHTHTHWQRHLVFQQHWRAVSV